MANGKPRREGLQAFDDADLPLKLAVGDRGGSVDVIRKSGSRTDATQEGGLASGDPTGHDGVVQGGFRFQQIAFPQEVANGSLAHAEDARGQGHDVAGPKERRGIHAVDLLEASPQEKPEAMSLGTDRGEDSAGVVAMGR